MTDFPAADWYYHWAPVSRRRSIEHSGLVPGRMSVANEWRPPYVCFSDSPWLASLLSVRVHPEIPDWDLWTAHISDVGAHEQIIDDRGPSVKEIRVYHRVHKSKLWYVATRSVPHGRIF